MTYYNPNNTRRKLNPSTKDIQNSLKIQVIFTKSPLVFLVQLTNSVQVTVSCDFLHPTPNELLLSLKSSVIQCAGSWCTFIVASTVLELKKYLFKAACVSISLPAVIWNGVLASSCHALNDPIGAVFAWHGTSQLWGGIGCGIDDDRGVLPRDDHEASGYGTEVYSHISPLHKKIP